MVNYVFAFFSACHVLGIHKAFYRDYFTLFNEILCIHPGVHCNDISNSEKFSQVNSQCHYS